MQVMHHLSSPAPGLLLHFTRLLPLLLADCPVTLGQRTPAEAQVSVVMSTRDINIISIGDAAGVVAVVILSVVVVAPAEVCAGRAVAVAKVQLAAVADAEVSAGVAVAQAEAAAVAAVAAGHRARCRGGGRAVARVQPGIFSVFGPQDKSSKFLFIQFSIIVPIAPLKHIYHR